ncbi:Thymidylate kinase [Thalassocella blandensis]|nr:Thymidylate kinase [Thalassocella blandensis]
MKGKFITVEGSEGVGKSTNIAFIKAWLKQKNIDVIHTREPGGTPLAEELRYVLLKNREENFNPMAELLVMFAARAQHLHEVILPAIERGQWVLCDRFTDATFAYQGFGRGLELNLITELESLVQQGVHPDKTFYLDIDVAIGLQRAQARGDLDRFENEKIEFFERVRQGYLERVAQEPDRYIVIDAGQGLADVQHDISAQLERLVRI